MPHLAGQLRESPWQPVSPVRYPQDSAAGVGLGARPAAILVPRFGQLLTCRVHSASSS